MWKITDGGLSVEASGWFTPRQLINGSFQNLCYGWNRPLVVLKDLYFVYLKIRRSWRIPRCWMGASVDKATRGVWTGVWGEKPRSLILPSLCLCAAYCGVLSSSVILTSDRMAIISPLSVTVCQALGLGLVTVLSICFFSTFFHLHEPWLPNADPQPVVGVRKVLLSHYLCLSIS